MESAMLTAIDCSVAMQLRAPGSLEVSMHSVPKSGFATAQLVAEFVAAMEAQLKPV